MDRRSLVVVGVLGAVLAAAVGVGIAVSGGGGGAVRTPAGSLSSAPPSSSIATTTTSAPIVAPSTVATPKPTVVIHPGASTTAPTTPTAPTTVPAGGDIGITPHTIRVAVIADTAPVVRGVEAWAQTVNQAGGLAGRMVRVDAHVVGSTSVYAAAVASACTTDFAIVGSSSAFDSQSGGLACGVPELATRVFDAAHQALANSFTVIPAQVGLVAVGAFKHLLGASGCCRQYVLVPTVEPGRGIVQRSLQGAAAVGFTTAGTPDVPATAGPAEYRTLVAELVAAKATFGRSGLGAASTVLLRKAAAQNPAAGVVTAWYCDETCADPPFLSSGGAAVEGQYVDVAVNPLSDQAQIPAMAVYVRAVKHLPTMAGLESYSAGLLFEQVARQVVAASGPNGLTRVRLLTAVGGVHAFNAGGILGTTDVAARQSTGCYALLQVQTGQLRRVFPTAPTQLDCGAQNLQAVPTGG